MKKVSYRSKLTAYCLSISAHFFFLLLTSHASVYGELLVQEWGVIPQSAGFIAAESWGIAPKSSSKNIVAFYQNQRVTSYIGLLEDNQNLLPAIGEIAMTPKNQLPPADGMPIVQGFCEIRGEVSDDRLNPVKGVAIELLGSGKTTETDGEGKFYIPVAPSGNITLEASKIGYVGTIQSATALAGQLLTVRISLKVKSADGNTDETMMDEETVVGEYQETDKQNFSLDVALENKVTASIGKEQFSRLGISDAAGAVGKIAGANIVGGKYAVVRGLGDRYSNTLVNSLFIPSADPSKRAVQLDLFPSNLLESVAITKNFSPELPAEFSGGLVEISSLSFPSKPIVQFSVGTEWQEQQPSGAFLIDPGVSQTALKMTLPNIPFGDGSYTGSIADSSELHLGGSMLPEKGSFELGQDYSLTLGNTWQIAPNVKLGTVIAWVNETDNTVKNDVFIGRGLIPARGNELAGLGKSQIENSYEQSWNQGVLTAVHLNVADKHQFGVDYFTYSSAASTFTKVDKQYDIGISQPIYVRNPYGAADDYTYGFAINKFGINNFEPLQRDLNFLQFRGKHILYGDDEKHQGKVSWGISGSDATEARPASRTLFYSQADFTDLDRLRPDFGETNPDYHPEWGVYESAGDLDTGHSPPVVESFKENLSTDEHGDNLRMDAELPIELSDDDRFLTLRFGYNHNKRDRTVRGRFFTYDFRNVNEDLLVEDFGGNFQGNYGNLYLLSFDELFNPDGTPKFPGLLINDNTTSGRTVRNVDAGNEINAYYFGTNYQDDLWDIGGGFRYEKEIRYYHILKGLSPGGTIDPVEQEEDGLYPAVNASLKLGRDGKHKILASWSRTVARPTFYEFAPVEIADQASGDRTAGNPNLTNTSIQNFDLSYSFEADDGFKWGMALFNKKMKDPIATTFDSVLNAKSWINGESGTLQGLEASIEFPKFFGITLNGNYTYIDSALTYKLLGKTVTTGFDGQPEHIINIAASYEIEKLKSNISLVYNFTGEFMTAVPTDPNVPPVVNEARTTMDFILTKQFMDGKCDGSVKLGIRNLLDTPFEQSYQGSGQYFQKYRPGRTASLSIKLEF